MKIALCSGGTGGHMFPACVLFRAIQQKGHDAIIVTDVRGNAFCDDIPQKIITETIRLSSQNPVRIVHYLLSMFGKFCKLWFRKSPDIVISFGGVFTIIPVVVAKTLGSKIVIYEQNSIVGKANKFLQKFADLKLSSFELDKSWVRTPAPVRSEFLKRVPYECNGMIKILVMGGSQGAASFFDIIPQALATLSQEERQSIEIVQQVSSENTELLSKTYKNLRVKSTLKKFVHDIAKVMLNSQLVICRAGASTLSELSATGRPSVLIPYPQASDNHQFHNAMYYKNRKAAWVLEEKDGIAEKLGEIIRQILQNRELLKTASFHMIDSSFNRATGDFIRLIELT